MVDRSYRLLGLMWDDSRRTHLEQSEFKSLAGYDQNDTRLVYDDEKSHLKVLSICDQYFLLAAAWVENIYNDFKTSNYQMKINPSAKVCSFHLLIFWVSANVVNL